MQNEMDLKLELFDSTFCYNGQASLNKQANNISNRIKLSSALSDKQNCSTTSQL